MILHCFCTFLCNILYFSDDGEGSFDDDFDKIESSVSAFYLDLLWFGFLVFRWSYNL